MSGRARITAASGDDGVHAEGDLTVDKGTLKVTSAVEGVEGADISVNGGTVDIRSSDDGINAAGGTSSSGGGGGGFGGGPGGGGGGESVGEYKLTVTGGTLVVDSDGKVVATYVTSKSIQNVVYSSSAVKSGEKYEIYSGGTKSGTGTGGLAASGTLGSAERIATVTAGEAPEGGFGGGRR